MSAQRLLDEFPFQCLARPVEPRILADLDLARGQLAAFIIASIIGLSNMLVLDEVFGDHQHGHDVFLASKAAHDAGWFPATGSASTSSVKSRMSSNQLDACST